MMKTPEPLYLQVKLYHRKIGVITRFPGDRNHFVFTSDYINDPNRPTLSLSFKDQYGNLLTQYAPTQTQLLPFFSNLLPEGHLRDYLAQRAGVNPVREFHLLQALGADLPGAVTIEPMGESTLPNADPYILKKKEQTAVFRFSLAGVQLKFSAIQNKGKTGGFTIPIHGVGGFWIAKLPSMLHAGVPENEFSMMSLARKIGINVPDIELVDTLSITNLPQETRTLKGKSLLIKRFDRSKDGLIHSEDFAQVFGVYPEHKYRGVSVRNIVYMLGREMDEENLAEFIKRLVFSTLIGNADMHLKNWSLIYNNRHAPQLAPAYDLLSTILYIPDNKAALKYGRTKRMDQFTYDELRWIARKAKVSEELVLKTTQETVDRFQEVWKSEHAHLAVSRKLKKTIEEHLMTLPLITERLSSLKG